MAEAVTVKAAKVSLGIVELLRERDGAGVSEVADHLNIPDLVLKTANVIEVNLTYS